MYAPFFGLAREPFSIAPDPRFLFLSEQHREALAHLLFGVGGGGGFVLLTGEIGAGKTTVCRCFLQQVPPHCSVAYLFNPQFDATELLDAILEEFKVPPVAAGAGFKARVDALNRFLLDQHAQGRAAVLVIDEAQGLAPSVLEQLRLLTNLETAERKLLQIILIGQPELRTLLKAPGLEQLAQRVIARYHLGPLNAGETAAYVRHRVLVAALPLEAPDAIPPTKAPRAPLPPLPFDEAALAEVHRRTGGVPRRINVLCGRALLGAYSRGVALADAAIVSQAAAEVFALDAPGRDAGQEMGRGATRDPSRHPGHDAVREASRNGRAGRPAGSLRDAAATRDRPLWPWGLAIGLGAVALAGWSVWVARGPQAPAAAHSGTMPAPGVPAAAAVSVAALPGATLAASAPLAPAAPASAAPRAATSAAIAEPVIDEPATLLNLAWRDESAALAALAAWGTPQAGRSTAFACDPRRELQCWRGRSGWPALQQADRPALLSLRGADGTAAYVLLVGLEAGMARVLGASPSAGDTVGTPREGAPARPLRVPVVVLAGVWRGEFLSLWTPPPGWREADARAAQPAPAWSGWLDAELQRHVQAAPGADWRDRVLAFQLAQGLPADGLPGPLTLMRLQRLSGAELRPTLGAPPATPHSPGR